MTRDEARWIATIAQGLDRRPFTRKVRKTDIMDLIERLGCVQLDTISVISRAHETVIWSRLGAYDPQLIVDLYDPDLLLTEYWAHAAAIIPTSMLPLFRGKMEHAWASNAWAGEPENARVVDQVLQRVRDHGPISSRDFEVEEGVERAAAWEWYGNKRERRALAELWTAGKLLVRKRERSFARVYDLPERVAPNLWTSDPLSKEYRQRALVSRAIRALGVLTPTWVADYFRCGPPTHVYVNEAKDLLVRFEREGRILPVEIPGVKGPVWLDAEAMGTLELLREGKGRPNLTTLLTPFDNLIWPRNRGTSLWGFDYLLECYVPAPKRIYGYYTLPILHRGRLVGRLEPSYDRRSKILTVKNLYLEPGVKATPPLVGAIVKAFDDLIGFLGGQPGSWRVLRTEPAGMLSLFDREPDLELVAT